MQTNSHICPEFTKGGKRKAEESQAGTNPAQSSAPSIAGQHTAQSSKEHRQQMPQQPGLQRWTPQHQFFNYYTGIKYLNM